MLQHDWCRLRIKKNYYTTFSKRKALHKDKKRKTDGNASRTTERLLTLEERRADTQDERYGQNQGNEEREKKERGAGRTHTKKASLNGCALAQGEEGGDGGGR